MTLGGNGSDKMTHLGTLKSLINTVRISKIKFILKSLIKHFIYMQ